MYGNLIEKQNFSAKIMEVSAFLRNFAPKIIKTMLNFISFGSGSSGNCYLLYTESEGLIIDHGIGTRTLKKYLREYGIPLSLVKYVLVTHDHADHVKSVGKFSQENDLDIHATKRVHVGINNNYCVRYKVPAAHARCVEPNVPFTLGEFHVMPFSVPHDSADNIGFLIETQGIKFCLMTDVGHVTEEMGQMIGQANYLVIEANYDTEMLKAGTYPAHLKVRIMGLGGHLSNADCAQALAENATSELRHVWLCHLSEENNHPELARKTVEQVLRSYGLVVGADFKLDVLKRTMPTGVFELKSED